MSIACCDLTLSPTYCHRQVSIETSSLALQFQSQKQEHKFALTKKQNKKCLHSVPTPERFKNNYPNIFHSFRVITQVNGLFTQTLTLTVSIRIYILSGNYVEPNFLMD